MKEGKEFHRKRKKGEEEKEGNFFSTNNEEIAIGRLNKLVLGREHTQV